MILTVGRRTHYSSMKLDETVLLEHAQNGDHRAFSELVRRHQATVERSCYRILGNLEDAKDASQETFLRAYRHLDTFQGRSTFKTWLLRVAMNVSLSGYTRGKQERSHINNDSLAVFVASTDDPEGELIRGEAAVRVHDALELVRPDHRDAIVVHDLNGLSYQETAELLGVAEGTVRSWVHRGRKRLKRILIAGEDSKKAS